METVGAENELRKKLSGDIIEWARLNLADQIDDAYEYFWEEEYPEDNLQGLALEIGFVNFEDWLLMDRRVSDGQGVIDLYLMEHPDAGEDAPAVLREMKDSVISLYEVKAAGPEVVLEDLLLGGEIRGAKLPAPELKQGDVFATRFFKLDGGLVMGECVYPFGGKLKDEVVGHIKKQFDRYRKNENPDGTMREFLKAYSDAFNTIWFSEIFGRGAAPKQGRPGPEK